MASSTYRHNLSQAASEIGADLVWHEDLPTGKSVGWVSRGVVSGPIYGDAFPLNSYSSIRLARDKVMASRVLIEAGVPTIRHDAAGMENPPEEAMDLIGYYGLPLVVKPYDGANGDGVQLIHTAQDLIDRLSFRTTIDPLAVCAYEDFDVEYRVVSLDRVALLRFGKRRSADDWKHNLSAGATIDVVDRVGGHSNDLADALDDIAGRASQALGLRFCTVDIAATPRSLKVLEVNGSVSLDRFVQAHPAYTSRVVEIYKTALDRFLSGVFEVIGDTW